MSATQTPNRLPVGLAEAVQPPWANGFGPAVQERAGPPHALLAAVFILLDGAAVAVSWSAGPMALEPSETQSLTIRVLIAAVALALGFIHAAGGYACETLICWRAQLRAVLTGVLGSSAALTTAGLAVGGVERIGFDWLAAIPLSAASVAGGRWLTGSVFLRQKLRQLAPRTVVLGSGANLKGLLTALRRSPEGTVRLICCIDETAPSAADEPGDPPIFRQVETLFPLIRAGLVDQVILAMPWSDRQKIVTIARRLADYPVHVRLAPDLLAYELLGRGQTRLGELDVFHLANRPIAGWRSAAKRAEDLLLGALALILFSPLLLAAAVCIKLDSPGPILFRQTRVGFNNRDFQILKLRTMRAEPDAPSGRPLRQAARRDPRVTRVGAVLRRTSIDEIPQLLNVLRGEMSLVGPRTHAPGTEAGGRPFEQVVARYAARHCVRPGITGLAQVRGWRGETATEDKLIRRVESDLEYIEGWSLPLDLAILARTVVCMISSRNAY